MTGTERRVDATGPRLSRMDRRRMLAFVPAALLAAAGAGRSADAASVEAQCAAFMPDPDCWSEDLRLARLWQCGQSDCPGYFYNPLVGEWTQDIPARTAFEDLPRDFWCPACGAEIEAFVLYRDLAA